MWQVNRLTQILNITYPIIQAPMVGCTTPKLVAEVSNAGGLGSLGAALLSPIQIREAIAEIKKLTPKPFSVNLFAPGKPSHYSREDIEKVNVILNRYRHELNIPEIMSTHFSTQDFHEQLAVILEEKVSCFSFTFGILAADIVKKIKAEGIYVAGTATTVHEAKLLEYNGVDMIIAQGYEAGGHRGTAANTPIEDALTGTIALVPQVVDHVKVPVIASGGIMDERGIVAALALGASGVQMGTAFLTCPEAHVHPMHREALLNSTDESTRLTRTFTGKYARSIKNRFLLEMEPFQDLFPQFPLQSALTQDIRKASAEQNNPDFVSMWAGQASSLCKLKNAKELIFDWTLKVKNLIKAMV